MKTVIATLLFLLSFSAAHSQILGEIRNTVNEVNRTARDINRTIRDVRGLKDEIQRTSKDFNSKGRVEKGNNKSTSSKKAKYAKIKAGEFENVVWTPVVYVEGDIFPSAIISLSSFTGTFNNELEVVSRPIGFVINAASANQIIRWEMESSDKRFFDKVSGEFIVDEADQTIHIMPEIPWNFQALTQNVTNTPASITYRFFDDKGNKIEQSQRVHFRSINDCILRYQGTNTHYLFAGYVQESHPEIDVILREALNTGFVNSFDGYQSSDPTAVIDQVLAIWRALHLRNFKYSSITTSSSNDSEAIFTQSVRTFDNSIKTSQANCVDGTVMFVSILRKIGINTQIITIPGHCYLAVFADRNEESRFFIETTALGSFPDLGEKLSPEVVEAYRDVFLKISLDRQQKHQELASKNQITAEINVEKARAIISAIPVY